MEVFSPATPDEAIGLAFSMHGRSTTPDRWAFTLASLHRLFGRGTREPGLIWAAQEGGEVLGMVGARHVDHGEALIDMFALPDEVSACDAVVAAATAWARQHGRAEASFEVPAADDPLGVPAAARIVDAFARHGWRVLVTRRGYAHGPDEALGRGVPDARLEIATDAGRVRSFVRRMLPGSLDVRDRTRIEAHGLDEAARITADTLLADDPLDAFRFHVIDGRDAGLVVARVLSGGTGYLFQVGVAEDFRGRGLATRLVATATRALMAEGAVWLVANTDDDNVPMRRAFASSGWPESISRIDLVLA